MIRRPPRSTLSSSSAASDVYKRQSTVGRLALFRISSPSLAFVPESLITIGTLIFIYSSAAIKPLATSSQRVIPTKDINHHNFHPFVRKNQVHRVNHLLRI